MQTEEIQDFIEEYRQLSRLVKQFFDTYNEIEKLNPILDKQLELKDTNNVFHTFRKKIADLNKIQDIHKEISVLVELLNPIAKEINALPQEQLRGMLNKKAPN